MRYLILFSIFMAANASELVEVKEIPAKIVAQIKAADAEIDIALAEFEKAKSNLLAAKAIKEALEKTAIAAGSPSEGKCSTGGPVEDHGSVSAVYLSDKRFRRATVRGKFLLIHEGTEKCSHWGTGFTTLTGTATTNLKMNNTTEVQ